MFETLFAIVCFICLFLICEITYYANEPEEEPYFIVEPAGEKLFNENSNAQP